MASRYDQNCNTTIFREELESELLEQARLVGMSAEREARLRATIGKLETENSRLAVVESNLHAEIERLNAENADLKKTIDDYAVALSEARKNTIQF